MQLKAAHQNGNPKVSKSRQWNFSSSGIIMFILPSFLSAYQSTSAKRMPAISEKMQIARPTSIVEFMRPLSLIISEGISTPPTTDASLATVMFRPSAKPNSFPLNQADIMAD